MARHHCIFCLRVVLFAVNFILWIAGLLTVGLSIYLRVMSERHNALLVANDLDRYYLIVYLLLATGVLVTFAGFMGCCASFLSSRCMVASFFSCVFLLFAAQLAVTVWIYVHKDQLDERTHAAFSIIFNRYTSDADAELTVDSIQLEFKCCGVDHYEDWYNSTWATEGGLRGHLPPSCCSWFRAPPPQCSREPLQLDQMPTLRLKGCVPFLSAYFRQSGLMFLCGSCIIIGAEMLSLIFSLTVCCFLRSQSGGGYKL